jgi:hypothetical protein
MCFLYFCKSEPVNLYKGNDPNGDNSPINEDEGTDISITFQQDGAIFADLNLLRVRADTKYIFSDDIKESDFKFIKLSKKTLGENISNIHEFFLAYKKDYNIDDIRDKFINKGYQETSVNYSNIKELKDKIFYFVDEDKSIALKLKTSTGAKITSAVRKYLLGKKFLQSEVFLRNRFNLIKSKIKKHEDECENLKTSRKHRRVVALGIEAALVKNPKKALIYYPQKDHNCAFNFASAFDEGAQLNLALTSLSLEHNIEFKRVFKIDDIVEDLKKQKGSAVDYLWIGGHGIKIIEIRGIDKVDKGLGEALALGKSDSSGLSDYYIHLKNIYKFKAVENKLSKNALIYIDGCGVGDLSKTENLIDRFAKVFVGRKTMGAVISVSAENEKFSGSGYKVNLFSGEKKISYIVKNPLREQMIKGRYSQLLLIKASERKIWDSTSKKLNSRAYTINKVCRGSNVKTTPRMYFSYSLFDWVQASSCEEVKKKYYNFLKANPHLYPKKIQERINECYSTSLSYCGL